MPIVIPPTRLESTVRSIGYFLLGVAGIWVLLNRPLESKAHLGLLAYVWGICLTTAFLASYASLRRRYRLEYTTLPMTTTGVIIYAYTVWYTVPDSLVRGPHALIATVVVCMLLIRLFTLHRLVVSWKGKPWIGSVQS